MPERLLVEIDCGPYKAALTQAQGALKRDQAILAGAQRDLARYQHAGRPRTPSPGSRRRPGSHWSSRTRARCSPTRARSPPPRSTSATAASPRRSTAASACAWSIPATSSPPALTTGIISVNQVEPIAVTFTVPQGDFQRLSAVSGRVRPSAGRPRRSARRPAPTLGSGELLVADNHVDQTTGTVQLKARFANAGAAAVARPVRQRQADAADAAATPSPCRLRRSTRARRAPSSTWSGRSDKAVTRPVDVVATEGATAVIQGGLKAGETGGHRRPDVAEARLAGASDSVAAVGRGRRWRTGHGGRGGSGRRQGPGA